MHQAGCVPKVDARRVAHHRARSGDDGHRLLCSCQAHAGPARERRKETSRTPTSLGTHIARHYHSAAERARTRPPGQGGSERRAAHPFAALLSQRRARTQADVHVRRADEHRRAEAPRERKDLVGALVPAASSNDVVDVEA